MCGFPFCRSGQDPKSWCAPWPSVLSQLRRRNGLLSRSTAFHAAYTRNDIFLFTNHKFWSQLDTNVSELSMDHPGLPGALWLSNSSSCQTDLDCQPSPMHGLKQYASTEESAVLRFPHSSSVLPPAGTHGPPVLQCTSAPPVANHQEELSLPSPQCMPPREPFRAGPCG
jgi:hypothetical protein